MIKIDKFALLLAGCIFGFFNKSSYAAQIAAIERNHGEESVDVLIDEGTLHGYVAGGTVCIYSKTGATVACEKIQKANELYSLIAVSPDLLSEINVDLLVLPKDFVAVKPKIGRLCQGIATSGSAAPLPEADAFTFDLYRQRGVAGFCSEPQLKSPTLGWTLRIFPLHSLAPDSRYNKVGFLTRPNTSSSKDYWGSQKSESLTLGYGTALEIESGDNAYIQFSYRALAPLEEDLNDAYKAQTSDLVRSRTTYESQALAAAYLLSKQLTWISVSYGFGLDLQQSELSFKSYRTGASNQVLGTASSKLSVLGLLGQARADLQISSFILSVGLQSVLPVTTLANSYSEEVTDITGETGNRSIKPQLAHKQATLHGFAYLGLGMQF